jgi:soluble lytic murein transglycosylase-like protein
LTKDFPLEADSYSQMNTYSLLWPIVSILAASLAVSGQTPAPPPPSKSSLEATAQKQREAALAAMQSSVEKQKAAVAASVGASISKQGQTLAGKDSFFTLAPLTPPAPVVVAQAAMPDVACDPVPEDSVAPIVLGAAQRESIDPKLVSAVIQQESGFRPCAISDKGAQGLMQLMPDTADRLSVKDPFDAKQNIDAGAKYLKELITKYSGNLALALSAYNAGPDTVDQVGGIPNIPETADYVKAILTKLGLPTPAAQTPAPITDPVPPLPPAAPKP